MSWFCWGRLPVLSGMEAWSVFLSFLKTMFPNWSTADTTFSIAVHIRENNNFNHFAIGCFLLTESLKRTDDLLVAEAHDVHCFHGLMEVVFVLLAWDCEVPVWQETVLVEPFQKQIRCGRKNGAKASCKNNNNNKLYLYSTSQDKNHKVVHS